MEMDGPTFCESKELEPEEHFHFFFFFVRTKISAVLEEDKRCSSRTNSLEFS